MQMPTETKKKPLRTILLIAVLLAAVAATGALLAHREPREWTTGSPAALAEFRRGLEADQKLYGDDAREHFERALELDPEFAAAKLYVVQRLGGEGDAARRDQLAAELEAVDRSRLSPRERFLTEAFLARRGGDAERALALLDDYRERYPDDPFALNIHCLRLWGTGEFAAAETHFRRLLKIDPNWVTAQNHLGYLAMAQADWKRAEEQFEIYRYLAPDQANPHDSLGELMLLTGRWDEARREFEAALAIKPDFCHSWAHLVTLELLTGRLEEAERTIEGIERDRLCSQEVVQVQRCRLGVWRAYSAGDWPAVAAAYRTEACARYYHYGDAAVMAYGAMLLAGLPDEAAALAEAMDHRLEKAEPGDRESARLHLEGVRLRLEGRPEEALERLRAADDLLAYWTSEGGYFKLFNRVELWRALTAAGRADEADRLLAELRAANPAVAERWTAQPDEQAAAAAPVSARAGL